MLTSVSVMLAGIVVSILLGFFVSASDPLFSLHESCSKRQTGLWVEVVAIGNHS
jgi:hypothetical protein